ncbi:MAG: hypothetical protein ACC707_18415 [Thiohalomonadales bacterium]
MTNNQAVMQQNGDMNILLSDMAFINAGWTPRKNANHLAVLAGQHRYLYVPLAEHNHGNIIRSVFRILINDVEYKIVWHGTTLIAVWRKAYGFEDEIKHWPKN